MGASVPPDEVVAGVVATAFAVSAPGEWSREARACLGVLMAVPFGLLGRWVDIGVRRWNGGLLRKALESGAAGRPHPLAYLQLKGAGRFFLGGALTTAAAVAAGQGVMQLILPSLPHGTTAVLELVEAVLPVLGVAAVLAGLGGLRYGAWFSAGLLGGFAAGAGGDRARWLMGRPWHR